MPKLRIASGLVALLACGCDRLLCDNALRYEVFSTDGRLSAGLFERNCGATAGFVLWVALRRVDESFPREFQQAVLTTAARDRVGLRWGGARVLEIELDATAAESLIRQEKRWNDVAIQVSSPFPAAP